MIKNMSSLDKKARIAIAVVIALLYFVGIISGTVALVLGVIALVFVVTSFISFCPLYSVFKISTKK